jgi:hypothetical protein
MTARLRTGRAASYLAMLLITFFIAECAARLMTSTAPNGLKTFWHDAGGHGIALLPLRPSDIQVRQALEQFDKDRLLMRDPDIGWIVRPNRAADGDYTNAQGIRTSPDHFYAVDPPDGKIRIETFGDSYVYCLQVKNGETWQDYIEQMRSDVQFLNFGLPGGGTDQAFLRWKRDGRRFKSDIVILGIWPDNILRNLAIMDYYRTGISLPLTKPRLVLDEDGSRFVNYPIMSEAQVVSTLTQPEKSPVLHYDYWYHYDDTVPTLSKDFRLVDVIESIWRRYHQKEVYRKILSGEIPNGIDLTVAIAKMFVKEVRDAGAIPLIAMIPDRNLLALELGDRPFPLVQRLRGEGLDVIDMALTFGYQVKEQGAAKYYVGGVGHNSPFGNQVFGRYLEKELRPWIRKATAARTASN